MEMQHQRGIRTDQIGKGKNSKMENEENNKYGIYKSCGKCGHKTFISLTKVEAAFSLYDNKKLWYETPCERCGSKKTGFISLLSPDLDEELFEIWGKHSEYCFLEQDEDLILAKTKNIPLLLKAFDNDSFTNEKQDVIVNALCTILFDNIELSKNEYTKEEEKVMAENRNKVLPELQKRKEKILSYKDCIWEYIWREVEKVIY